MENTWTHYAEKLLKMMYDKYPTEYEYGFLIKFDKLWQDYRVQIAEAIDFLIEKELIVETVPGSKKYRCSTKGRKVYDQGLMDFIESESNKVNKDEKIKDLSLELLQQQIKEIKRNNRFWIAGAIAGIIAFIYNLLQIFDIV